MNSELTSVSADEAVLFSNGEMKTYSGLTPSTTTSIEGVDVRTLPQPGEFLSRIATTNDVHFGELECGRSGDTDDGPIFSVNEGDEPYPALMNRLGVGEIAAVSPDLMVVKGDLTAEGRDQEFQDFLRCYQPVFRDRLRYVRGNHDCYEGQSFADWPFQEVTLEGVIVALLDTSRPHHINGSLSHEQLEQLDELGERADRPVIVLGHHPIWDERFEPRSDDVFSLQPEPTEDLLEVFARRPRLVSYAAGHTHRNHVVEISGVPFVEVASLKDFPGSWCEYQVFDGGILQIVRRVQHRDAVAWTEKTRRMFGGAYGDYAFGSIEERCRLIETTQV